MRVTPFGRQYGHLEKGSSRYSPLTMTCFATVFQPAIVPEFAARTNGQRDQISWVRHEIASAPPSRLRQGLANGLHCTPDTCTALQYNAILAVIALRGRSKSLIANDRSDRMRVIPNHADKPGLRLRPSLFANVGLGRQTDQVPVLRAGSLGVENVFWPEKSPPKGPIQIFVHHYRNHGLKGCQDPTRFVVRVQIDNEIKLFKGAVSFTGNRMAFVARIPIPSATEMQQRKKRIEE